jgi:tetratricopeptide (TPR) repeat protein
MPGELDQPTHTDPRPNRDSCDWSDLHPGTERDTPTIAMYIEERKNLFHKGKRGSNPYIVMLLLLLIVALVAVLRAYGRGEIWPPFVPTPTPTRTVNSYRIEGEMHFKAGSLERAINAYKQAILLEPENVEIRIELAKIQVYSSESLTTDQSRRDRLNEALEITNQAKEIAPTNSNVLATRAFVLDWNGNSTLYPDRYKDFQDQAEQEALLSLQLDTRNVFAMIYYAEVLTYQFKWVQATEYLTQAEEMGAKDFLFLSASFLVVSPEEDLTI